MKIALCLEYPIDQHGGTEVLVRELIKGLSSRNSILLVSGESTESAMKSSVGGFLSGHIPYDPKTISSAQSRQLAAALAREKVDLAHFHFGGNYGWENRAFNQCPVVHVSRRGIPCLSTNHGAFSIMEGFCGPQRSPLFRLALFPPAWLSKQYVLSFLRCEVTVSQHDFHAVRRWYPAMRHKFRQIYHSQLHGSPAPIPMEKRRKTILCVGTIGLRKGQWILVEAFARVAARYSDWQLILIGRMGDDLMSKKVRDLAGSAELKNRAQLLGPKSDAEVEQWLKETAIFAMPSFQEGLGLSLQEALFHGCACVASRAGGISDLIENDANGLLVTPGNVNDLATALEKLMSNEALRIHFATAGPRSVLDKEMTAERMVGKYQDLYQEILQKA